MSNLNLDIHDFGPINQANIELKKLNIIAGINGSGKTTSSKLLYCFLTSNSNESDYLANKSIYKRFLSIATTLDFELNFDSENSSKIRKLSYNLSNLRDKNFNSKVKTNINKLKIIINESEIKNKNEYLEQITDIENALEINNNERRKFFNVSNTLLKSEFNINDLKINEKTNVHFFGQQNDCKFSYKLDSNEFRMGFIINKGNLKCLNFEKIIYIDSASIFDIDNTSNSLYLKNPTHNLRFLASKIYLIKDNEDVYDSIFNEKLDECIDKINSLIGGNIYYNIDEREFLFQTDDGEYHMKNTASGIKQIGIIQILLSNRILNKDSFLIIDEPEVNLHPDWQVKLAETLALLISKLNIHIYITSHSPMFIEAMSLYSEYYNLLDETNIYLTNKQDKRFIFNKISADDMGAVYENLTRPYDELDIIKSKILFNE